jgi:dTDP-4-dehydrorhamnose reductase
LQQSIEERNAGEFKSNLYHLTASGYTSWHGFAYEILSVSDKILSLKFKTKDVIAISSSEYPACAKRPMSSRLMTGILQSRFGVVMPVWSEGLSLCLEELIKNN